MLKVISLAALLACSIATSDWVTYTGNFLRGNCLGTQVDSDDEDTTCYQKCNVFADKAL